jgi:transcription termination factor Rho
MDEVIFEEFKGTGNMEIYLDRSLVDRRIFPSINIEKSGTRKEELLYHPDEYQRISVLRRALVGVPPVESMELLLGKLKKTPNNIMFLLSMGQGSR